MKKFNSVKKSNDLNMYDLLIPKYIYTTEMIDLLDYFIDYNISDFTEYIDIYDIYNVIFDFNKTKCNNFAILFENFNFLKFLKFHSFVYLYKYIYVYIDKKPAKFIYLSFFFMN